MSVCFGGKIQCEHAFFLHIFFIFRLKMHARCVSSPWVWVWNENYLGTTIGAWEHRYLCYESWAGVWSEVSLGFRVMVKKFISLILFSFGHNVLDWMALPWNFLLTFETFLGGDLRHNVYRGYMVLGGTIIYCSLPVYKINFFPFALTSKAGN